jgi:hypothetical protein
MADQETLQAIQQLGTTMLARLDAQDKANAERHIEHQRGLAAAVVRITKLEERVGSPTDPPTAAMALNAHRTASDASLETAALEGRVIALSSEVAKVAKSLDENNTMTKRILDNVAAPLGAILRARPVQAAVMAVLLAALGAAGAMLQNRATGPLMLPEAPHNGAFK